MKIGFLIEDRGFDNICFGNIEEGNPGVGGTWYEFVLVAYCLKKYRPDYDILIYHYNLTNTLPEILKSCIIASDLAAIEDAVQNKVDFMVFRTGKGEDWYSLITEYDLSCIGWAHNFLSRTDLELLTKTSNVKKVIFVGEEEYDRYLDDDITKKSTFIYNIVEKNDQRVRKYYDDSVVFIGSITPSKGFHILAKSWKYIVRKCPSANLYVIGSGALYDKNAELGQYGLAERKYEESFIKYLTDTHGNLLKSVYFLGVLSEKKKDIIVHTSVGVVNPTCDTETFCIGAVEFEQYGIPVCSGKKNGLLDTVEHRMTGLLSKSDHSFRRNVVRLLNDKELNNKYGNAAIRKSKEFLAREIIPDWIDCFEQLKKGDISSPFIRPKHYSLTKIVRIALRFFRITMGLRFLPSLNTIHFRLSVLKQKIEKLGR